MRDNENDENANNSSKKYSLTHLHKKVYELIWKRTIASQMKPSVYNELSYDISNENKPEIY